MRVSNLRGAMEGLGLLRVLIEATGLPPEAVERELNKILFKRNLTADTLTIEDVRDVLACYLQDVLVEAKAEISTASASSKDL